MHSHLTHDQVSDQRWMSLDDGSLHTGRQFRDGFIRMVLYHNPGVDPQELSCMLRSLHSTPIKQRVLLRNGDSFVRTL